MTGRSLFEARITHELAAMTPGPGAALVFPFITGWDTQTEIRVPYVFGHEGLDMDATRTAAHAALMEWYDATASDCEDATDWCEGEDLCPVAPHSDTGKRDQGIGIGPMPVCSPG